VVAIVAAAALGIYGYQQNQKRKDLLAQWAFTNGWSIAPRDDSWCDRWPGTPFGVGTEHQATSVISGSWQGSAFVCFDYRYVTGSGKSREVHRYWVSAFALPGYLPGLEVTPENALTRLGDAVGIGTDIDLESEDFNRAFRVRAHDPKFASDVLTPRTMEMLLSRPRFNWRICGAEILCWEQGRQTPKEVTAAVSTVREVVKGIPAFVWHDNGVGGSDASGQPTVGGQA
jgi:hypothetical protein